ncbi:anti-sigma factor family protein [Streptomyces sp. SP18CS02]|uniref:anti-sigma factor family protein n=1 Tax=Streptomyces sp. SP18CS02 TaxID=3002531 RepID=UPI002E76339F|nr:zf-HC2 domain-containing protein [Streptomyces sp. SP18CS02]MEE1756402.1 zf-HC2 domain-containing protein [Streptomyces sp. SP18CS02]
MSGTSPTPAEQHLGDRLAALVDGELGHDSRERVLAHLATCAKCKAEADAQRRLKSVFAQAAPPPPSEGLLARLQGLPGGAPDDDDDRGGTFGSGRFGDGVFGMRTEGFGYVPLGGTAGAALPGGPGTFPIHEVGRPGAERSPWRGRRFAFAAASAVSFAAIALGGALPATVTIDARGEGRGNNVTPLGAPSQTPAGSEGNRRRSGNGTPARSADRPAGPVTGAPVQARRTGAPPLFAVATAAPAGSPAPMMPATALSGLHGLHGLHGLSHLSALSRDAVPLPLIRPTGSASGLATATGLTPTATPSPSRLVAPAPGGSPVAGRR